MQYSRLKRFFNWPVARDYIDRNPLDLTPHTHIDEKVVATVSEQDFLKLPWLVDPRNSATAGERFRIMRNRTVLYVPWNTPSRLNELAGLGVDDVDLHSGGILVMVKGRKERWMPLGASV